VTRSRWVVLAAVGALIIVSAAAAATPSISHSISGTQGNNGWFVSAVTLTWTVTGATSTSGSCKPGTSSVTVSGDTAAASFGCKAFNGEGSSEASPVVIGLDRTAPHVAATPARAPDSNGWYNKPVGVTFSGSDATSGIESCTASSATYSGPDNGSASVGASCKDKAGNTGSGSVPLKYDATPPQVVGAAPDRPPDAGGFYNHPVSLVFQAQDAASGVQACAQVRYEGPEGDGSVTGTCRDNAGNESPPFAVKLRYDSKPPTLEKVKVKAGGGVARLSWKMSKDTALVRITRSPGRAKQKQTVVYSRRGAAFTDKRLKNGTRYTYVVSALDVAGNVAEKKATVLLRMGLYSPALGARVKKPPLLRWSAVPGAGYYNVQVHRGGTKLLSAWPARPALRLQRSWKFGGSRVRLTPGVYTWYVWPGFGSRSQNRYGKLVGKGTFVVTR
jgi:hypothetical protein